MVPSSRISEMSATVAVSPTISISRSRDHVQRRRQVAAHLGEGLRRLGQQLQPAVGLGCLLAGAALGLEQARAIERLRRYLGQREEEVALAIAEALLR